MIRFKGILALAGLIAVCAGVLGVTTAHAEWLSPDWKWRIEFHATDGSIAGSEAFADFTLLLELDAVDFTTLFSNTDLDGDNLRITAGDGVTTLDHELVSYDPVAQTAEIWFRALQLSDAQRSFYLYFDMQPTGDGPVLPVAGGPGSAWTPQHLAVYHFAEDPSLGALKDWGPHAHDAVPDVPDGGPTGPGWTSSNRVAGQVGDGWFFDGIDLFAHADNVASTDSSFTVSAWFANSPLVDKGAMAFQAPDGVWNMSFHRRGGSPFADVETPSGSLSWLPDVLDAAMHEFVWTFDAVSDTVRFYLDGLERSCWFRYPSGPSKIWTGETLNGRVGIIGPTFYNPLDIADGVADEFRLIEGVRSPEWILTEHRNQLDPTGFFEVMSIASYSGERTGLEDPVATVATLGRITVAPNPFNGVAHIAVQMPDADVTVRVYDMRGRLVRTLAPASNAEADRLQFLWDGCDERGTGVSNGIYFIRALSDQAEATRKAILVR